MYIPINFLIEVALFVGVFVAGYYVGHRGLTGVQKDLVDVKTDLSSLKAKVGV